LPEKDYLLDGQRTSAEWQELSPDVCVLPVGAFEQHSRHLPIACDDIEAEYFGAFLAKELGAALLPALNYGTSLEQTGFKGTITLRPETLMQIVRDIADEVEGQGFRTLIVLNGHGGNYALGPVIRDINRRNRPLKILLVPFWVFIDDGILDSPELGKPDMHSGEFETSLMLALRPDLVKPGGVDMEPRHQGFQQADLNTFGFGYNAEAGAYGSPSLATREKGEQLIAAIKRNMLSHVSNGSAGLMKTEPIAGKDWTKDE